MALRDINLVPPQETERRRQRRHLLFWSGCLAGVLALITCVYFLQAYTLQDQKRRLHQMRDVPVYLTSRIEDMKRLQSEQEKLNQQRAAMNVLLQKDRPYSQVLWRLSAIMNADTWISQLSIDEGKGKDAEVRLTLTGFSHSNENLGDFLDRLATDAMFRSVVLKFAHEGEKDNLPRATKLPANVIQFQIECHLAKG
jgi:Tfp pilus assembly protein PilN